MKQTGTPPLKARLYIISASNVLRLINSPILPGPAQGPPSPGNPPCFPRPER